MAKFVEQAQVYFAQLRDVTLHFTESLSDIVANYISLKLATQDFSEVPEELKHCLEDRDALMNLLAGMKDWHIQRIDEREDKLMNRSKEFIDNMVDQLNKYDRYVQVFLYLFKYSKYLQRGIGTQ